ncbi:HEAT repeat domain-containing protein [Streptomyces sp. NPDC090036]|uniref:HEAT repeat domain-containing protein n=1 Tax=Streptomyces sp. NPDC090036 TaxID=3365926 RepID=UPI003824FB26
MTDRDARLVAAVRAGHLSEVHDLLRAGADPGAADTDGLPVLCTAVAAFADGIAEALVGAGADPDQVLPDGTTPQVRAGRGAGRTGGPPTRRVRVDWAASRGVLAQCPEETWSRLVALRRHPSPDHRRFVADCLQSRESFGRWGVSPYDKAEGDRLLAAWVRDETDGGVLGVLLDAVHHAGLPEAEDLGLRHAGHPDARARREVPHLFALPPTPAATGCLYELAYDSAPEVRGAAAGVLGRGGDGTPATRALLLDLLRDPDTSVRITAADVLAASGDRTPTVVAALVALLDEEEQELRLEGAYGLALRGDPRAGEAYERVGPLGPAYEYDRRARRPGT